MRIRNVTEMMGFSQTIWDASKRLKGDFPTAKKYEHHQQDIGISQAVETGARQLDQNEMLIVVAHGSAPSKYFDPKLGGYSAASLAETLSVLFPKDYNGSVYLDGCNTGRRLDYEDGTSFIELFAKALSKTRKDIIFTVKGNIGPAATSSEGAEYNEITKEEADVGALANWSIIEQLKDKVTKYKVRTPFGLAFCRFDGQYNDYGLSAAVKKKREAEALKKQQEAQAAALKKQQEAEAEAQKKLQAENQKKLLAAQAEAQKKINAMMDAKSSLRPLMSVKERDEAWNQML